MSWFDDTFLPSLFQRIGPGRARWLTVKQTAICCQYMEPHSVKTNGYQGYSTTHIYYTYVWDGREVVLQYSKKNGCGTIQFYMNKAEQEAARISREMEKAAEEAAKIQRIRSDPARLEKWVAKLTERLHNLECDLEHEQHALADMLRNPENEDPRNIQDCIQDCKELEKRVEATRAKLEQLTAAD